MENITLQAHFDGNQILLDEPIELEPGAKLLVTVVSASEPERHDWMNSSMMTLEKAYDPEEPEYPISLIKEHNPEYDRG